MFVSSPRLWGLISPLPYDTQRSSHLLGRNGTRRGRGPSLLLVTLRYRLYVLGALECVSKHPPAQEAAVLAREASDTRLLQFW